MNILIAAMLLAAEPQLSLEETITKCAAVSENEARLSCFDQLAKALSGPVASAEVQTAPIASAQNTPAAEAKAAPEQPAEQKYVILRADDPKLKAAERAGLFTGFFKRERYEAKVVAYKRNNVGVLFIELDNGEIWRENRAMLRRDPSLGETVVLSPSPTGGWFVDFQDAGRKTKMRRFDFDE